MRIARADGQRQRILDDVEAVVGEDRIVGAALRKGRSIVSGAVQRRGAEQRGDALEARKARRGQVRTGRRCGVEERGGERRQIGRAHAELQSLMRISYAVFCLKKKKRRKRRVTVVS